VLPSDPQGDGASQWIQHDAELPDRHLPGSAWSGSDANDRPSFAIQCLCSSDNPDNSIPRPSNVAALLRQEV